MDQRVWGAREGESWPPGRCRATQQLWSKQQALCTAMQNSGAYAGFEEDIKGDGYLAPAGTKKVGTKKVRGSIPGKAERA